MNKNMRPGVYSDYSLMSVYSFGGTKKHCAVVARGSFKNDEDRLKVHEFSSYSDAAEVLMPDGEGQSLFECVRLILEEGVSRVIAVSPDDGYESAFEKIAGIDNIGAVVCDCDDLENLTLFKQSLEKASGNLRERIGFCGVGKAVNAQEIAEKINSERVVVCSPDVKVKESGAVGAVFAPCLFAARILINNEPTYNFNGEDFNKLDFAQRLEEEQIQKLIAGGVSVFEKSGENVRCIRAVTTRTKTEGVNDVAFRSVNTTLIIDYVISGLRDALKLRMKGGGISANSTESVAAQIVVELEKMKEKGIIKSYAVPRVFEDTEDPSVCVAEISFKIAHVISAVYIKAHIEI